MATFLKMYQASQSKSKKKPKSIQKLDEEALKKFYYTYWIDQLKCTQRPIWVDAEINFCYICEDEFSLLNRQHNCRKCGTVICNKCSQYQVALPELAYYDPVRICFNCHE